MKAKLGLVYAGGRGLRMGGVDKGAMVLDERPLHQWVIERLSSMCEILAVVAPARPDWLDTEGPVEYVSDETIDGEPIGPAGALLAGLKYLQHLDDKGWMITAAIDAPFFPKDIIDQLYQGRMSKPVAIAKSDDGLHPTFGLWNAACFAPVETAIASNKMYALRKLVGHVGGASVDVVGPAHQFLNINTPNDMERARRVLEAF